GMNCKFIRRVVINIKVKNIYYLIAGFLAVLFAFTHGYNGQSTVLLKPEVQAMSMDTQTVFAYVWHIITAENLIFGLAFFFMSFQSEQSRVQFAAWVIVAFLIVRLMVILVVTALFNYFTIMVQFIFIIALVCLFDMIVLF